MKQAIFVFLERYFLALAKVVLRIYQPLIIGITGSVGKTTVKEAVAGTLKGLKQPVLKTEGNLNADLGIALTILGYDHSPAIWEWPLAFIWLHLSWLFLVLRLHRLPKYFVVEMGIDRLGDMARMIKTVRPTIGVVTWIGEGHHLEYLKDPKTIALEKGLINSVMPPDGLAIIPAHDPNVETLEKLATGKVYKVKETGLDAVPEIVQAIIGYLKLDKAKAKGILAELPQPKGRLTELAGINDTTLVDDSYNTSLPAVRLALKILQEHPGKRKIAVLGDVLEQGDYEVSVHQQIAELARKQADLFIGVGKRMKSTQPDQWFASPDEAAEVLPSLLQPGDVILVKGSQGMRMEKISAVLAEDKELARQRLPRQNKRWLQIPFQNP